MKCLYCSASCIKRGKVRNIQRYQCKHCGKFQQEKYLKLRISKEKYQWVKQLTCEGCGISSISRLLAHCQIECTAGNRKSSFQNHYAKI